jgi:hypothetical protein
MVVVVSAHLSVWGGGRMVVVVAAHLCVGGGSGWSGSCQPTSEVEGKPMDTSARPLKDGGGGKMGELNQFRYQKYTVVQPSQEEKFPALHGRVEYCHTIYASTSVDKKTH